MGAWWGASEFVVESMRQDPSSWGLKKPKSLSAQAARCFALIDGIPETGSERYVEHETNAVFDLSVIQVHGAGCCWLIKAVRSERLRNWASFLPKEYGVASMAYWGPNSHIKAASFLKAQNSRAQQPAIVF